MEMALGFTGNSIYCRDDGDGPRWNMLKIYISLEILVISKTIFRKIQHLVFFVIKNP
jgi:hypothetical protein